MTRTSSARGCRCERSPRASPLPHPHTNPGPTTTHRSSVASVAQNNRICIIDLNEKNDDHTFKKMCLANYMNVADPYDVDGNGVFTYAFSQWTTEQLMIYDEHCYIAGTDTNFPAVNQFGLIPAEAPDLGQTFDTRWMMVCFHDAVFAAGAGHFPHSSPPALSDAPDCGEAHSCPKGSMCLAVYQQGMRPSREMLFGSSPDVPAALAHKCLAL